MRTAILLILLAALVACTKPDVSTPAQPAAAEEPQPTGLERIPDPDPTKYPRLQELSGWQNPQLVVREDGIGLVDIENHEIHILTPEQIPAELVSLPVTSWPYGRVVMVSQVVPKDASDTTKARVRENRGLLFGTLKDLQVRVFEAP